MIEWKNVSISIITWALILILDVMCALVVKLWNKAKSLSIPHGAIIAFTNGDAGTVKFDYTK